MSDEKVSTIAPSPTLSRISRLASASLASSRAQMTVMAPASANLQAAARPDARRAAGDEDDLAADGALQGMVDRQRRVQVALPVVPEAPGVVVEARALDARAPQRGQRLATVVAGREVDEGEHVLGQAEVLQHRRLDAAHGRQRHEPLLHALRDEADQRGIDEQVHLRRVRCLAEDVENVPDAIADGVDEMEAALAELRPRVADVVERGDDEVDRDDVDAPAFEADRRHPRRQDLPHALDQLEEVVRAVDLVHLAGLRVADDERRPVHRPRHLALLENDLLALVLGHE
jgi:hypothetical protein